MPISSTPSVLHPANSSSSSLGQLLAYMQLPVNQQQTTLKITGFGHAHIDQIGGEASTLTKNHAEKTQTDRPLSESCYPRANSKNSCFLSSVAGSTEYFLSPSFLMGFLVKVTILGEGKISELQTPKTEKPLKRGLYETATAEPIGNRQAHG